MTRYNSPLLETIAGVSMALLRPTTPSSLPRCRPAPTNTHTDSCCPNFTEEPFFGSLVVQLELPEDPQLRQIDAILDDPSVLAWAEQALGSRAPKFASRLAQQDAIEELRFLQVLLDAHQGPTYQFGPGVATTSLAAQAAARLGVTGDQLSALIRRNVQRSQVQQGEPRWVPFFPTQR